MLTVTFIMGISPSSFSLVQTSKTKFSANKRQHVHFYFLFQFEYEVLLLIFRSYLTCHQFLIDHLSHALIKYDLFYQHHSMPVSETFSLASLSFSPHSKLQSTAQNHLFKTVFFLKVIV